MTIIPIKIRTARLADTEALADFNCAMAQETEGKSLDRNTLKSGIKAVLENSALGFYLVAEVKKQVSEIEHTMPIVAGLMVTKEWSDWRNGEFWWIQSVYVRPEFRKQGIYRSLYHFVQQRATQENVCGFRLYVEKDNDIAQKTYRALGMHETAYKMYEQRVDGRDSEQSTFNSFG